MKQQPSIQEKQQFLEQAAHLPVGSSVGVDGEPLCIPHLITALIGAAEECLWDVANYAEEGLQAQGMLEAASLISLQSSFIWELGRKPVVACSGVYSRSQVKETIILIWLPGRGNA